MGGPALPQDDTGDHPQPWGPSQGRPLRLCWGPGHQSILETLGSLSQTGAFLPKDLSCLGDPGSGSWQAHGSCQLWV